jgi:hypothetical protein
MEGRAATRPASTKPRTAKPRTQAKPVDPTLQLRNSLIQKLRRGDHL